MRLITTCHQKAAVHERTLTMPVGSLQSQGSSTRTVHNGTGTAAPSCEQGIFRLGTGISFSCEGRRAPARKWKVPLHTFAATDLCLPTAAVPQSGDAARPCPTSPALVQDSPLGASAGPGSAGRLVSGPGCAQGHWRCPPQTLPKMKRSQ